MLLHLNGEPREFPDGLTIAALVAQLGMKPDRVAVELNLEIVPRANWEAATLKEGDRLEVVHFVGGGGVSPGEVRKPESLSVSSPATGAEWPCPTCGTLVSGKFCPDCGEKKFGAADLSIRHFFTHALGEFFHFDSNIFRSFRLLFTRPGFLTSEYLRGCRKPYLHPFQLFFVANLIYFLLQPMTTWSGLKAWLYVQTHMQSYSGFASRLAAHRMAAKGMTELEINQAFDHAVNIQARSLVVFIVPLFALLVWLLEWRKRRFFGEHLVFSLHFTAFLLLAVYILIYGGSTAIIRILAHFGINSHAADWHIVLAALAYAAIAIYFFWSLRAVYGDSIVAAVIKAILLTASSDFVVEIYSFILFLTALYSF
jgi:thiamine biosynthesis protein ThiS